MNNDMTVNKIGFACKWIDHAGQVNGIKPTDDCKQYNTSTTTVAWLNRQSQAVAEQKLWDLMIQNIESTRKLVQRVGQLDEHLRMVRISSDLLPVYTHNDFKYFWQQTDVRNYAEQNFAKVGHIARDRGVILSFHPGQHTCIVSDRESVVTNSLAELEYHADMATWMGYGNKKLDFKINVHLSGRRGIDGFEQAWKLMSPELRNCLTLENDEYQKGIDDLLPLANKVGIVLDIHHHFIKTGEYIQRTDPQIERIIDSWQGVTPTIHYSQSRSEYIGHLNDRLPLMTEMLAANGKSKLRAHSDFYDNEHINKWALSHLEWANIMCESKGKNLAASQFAQDNS